jgi:hypothetical protein
MSPFGSWWRKVYPKDPEIEGWELRIQRNKTKGARTREGLALEMASSKNL